MAFGPEYYLNPRLHKPSTRITFRAPRDPIKELVFFLGQ